MITPDYFHRANGKNVQFYHDCLLPFAKKFTKQIQAVEKRFFIFLEGEPERLALKWEEKLQPNHGSIVNASHWYDVSLLFTKFFFSWFGIHVYKRKLVFGKKNVQAAYNDSIKMIKNMSIKDMQSCPTLIGETGIPMDMFNNKAFYDFDYSKQEQALNRIFQAIEANMVHVTIWNYTPDNGNLLGDRWNGEDLSIYSADTPKSVDKDGGRGTKAFSRPYPRKTKGQPIAYSFDYSTGQFQYSFKQDSRKQVVEAEIYLPPIHYSNGFEVQVNSGTYNFNNKDNILYFKGSPSISYYIMKVFPKPE